jgi:signal transduction histidine kinase
MCAAKALLSVRLPEFSRTTTFRWTLVASGGFALFTILMFGFVYWQTTAEMVGQIDAAVTRAANVIQAAPPESRVAAINERLRQDLRGIWLVGLYRPDGEKIIGNMESMPRSLQPDASPQKRSVIRIDAKGRERQVIRVIARVMANGEILVVGRSIDELTQISEILAKILTLGLLPALCLGFAAGGFLSARAQRRVEQVNRNVRRIIAGELRQRLPTQGIDDPFDKLAIIVNGMLDEIETLIQSIASVGNDIAHDLRTPLTRVRVGLERSRKNAASLDDLRTAVDQAIVGLDQSLAIITALLRIAEIEQSRRLAGFSTVALADLMREIGDLYEPIAEDKSITFEVEAGLEISVRADRDLLFEAIANLVDNAIKFTPQGGRVELILIQRGDQGIVRVSDTGPGISASERDLIVRRFYRSDKSRGTPGLGLGLSLVAAIVKLHGFGFTIIPGPGFAAEISCPRAHG